MMMMIIFWESMPTHSLPDMMCVYDMRISASTKIMAIGLSPRQPHKSSKIRVLGNENIW